MKALLSFFIATLPFQFTLNPFPTIDLALGRVIAAVLCLGWFVASLKRGKLFIRANVSSALLLFFFLWSALSLLNAQELGPALRKLLFLGTFFPLFWIVPSLISSSIAITRVCRILIFSGLAASLVGLLQFTAQFVFGYEEVLNAWAMFASFLYGVNFGESVLLYNSWLVNIGGETYFRAISFFPDPHIFAFYLAFVIPLALFSSRRIVRIAGIISCAALLTTFSRAGYVGAICAFLGYGAFCLMRLMGTRSFSHVIGYVFAGVIFLVVALPFRDRLLSSFSFEEGSVQGRLTIWSHTFSLIRRHPLLGVGLGNYGFALEPAASFRTPFYAHNFYLDIASELGLIGLASWLMLMVHLCMRLVPYVSKNPAASAVFISLLWFSVQSFFDTAIFSVAILPLLILFLALADRSEELARTEW